MSIVEGSGAAQDDGPATGPGAPPPGPGGSVLRRRGRLLLAVTLVAAAVSGAGLAASLVIRSPAQAAAESEPPPPDVLTATVEQRVLTDSVVLRGQVGAGQTVEVAPAGSGGPAGAKPVVTKLPVRTGDQVAAGQSVLEVSGRPVFALRGGLPVYRDLRPGATGQDVEQLQQALKELGFGSDGDPAGRYGAATGAAVTAFYAARGYDPRPASPDGDAQVSAAQDAVTGGERALADGRDALKAAQKRLDDALAAERARSAAPTPGAPAGEPAGAPVGESPVDAARTAVETARKQVTRAGEDLTGLRKKAADVRATVGPMVPAAELLFLTGFPARVDGVAGRVGGEVTGTVLTVSAGALVVKGSLTAPDKGLVRPGQQVEILSEVTGTTATATVTAVADTPGEGPPSGSGTGTAPGGGGARQPGTDRTGYPLVVEPDAPLDPRLAGQDVRLTVRAASSAGPVLVVPLSAVSATADGRTVVTVYEGGGRRRVEVTPGMVGGGSTEVRPLAGGALGPGDQVIVGVRAGTR
ncbi:peptidoglycan-binding protein [Kitasatospora sp. NPDC086009]|uniref:peptidoglycan-binding protein n=1 Tax=unclassified Kitasatospora TaxID=2633591 RepID=UPI0037CBDB71